ALNYGGQGDDGFLHRLLIAYPEPMVPKVVSEGVPDECVNEYKVAMTRLFQAGKKLTYASKAQYRMEQWGNNTHYAELSAETPAPVTAKYRKLWEYAHRLSLVIHELRRACGEVESDEVDVKTVSRVIDIIDFFKAHMPRVQALLNEASID